MLRRRLSAALLATMVAGGLGWMIAWQPLQPLRPMPSDHQELERFAAEVAERTPLNSSIYFVLPSGDSDGGLANHRLRYILGQRYVATNLDEFSPPLPRIDYVAVWRDGHGTLEAAH
jgi:hypothetical protein